MISATAAPKISSRATALLTTLIAVMLLLLGAASAQAKPSDPPVDFLFEINATSASFNPVADAPGEYELVLHGASPKAEVSELTEEGSALLPLNHFLAYWRSYGDVTGQFTANPPRAVLHGLNPADGVSDEVVVRLRDASRKGTTLTFDAEIIESTRVWGVLDKKIAEVDGTLTPGDPDLEPNSLTDVEMFVDMPQRIVQPKPESEVRIMAATPTQPQPSVRLSCSGVTSSQLVTCWDDIGDYREESANGIVCEIVSKGFVGFTPWRGFFFDGVGEVDLQGYHWNPGTNFMANNNYRNPPNMDHSRCIRYFTGGNWYGIHRDAITYYTTSRCSYFMARWSTRGKCY